MAHAISSTMPIVPISTHSTDPTSPITSSFRSRRFGFSFTSSNILALKPGNAGKRVRLIGNQPRHVGGRLIERGARLQPRDAGEAEVAEVSLGAIELERKDQRRLLIEEPERVGQHADDLARLAVEHDAAPDRRRIGAEAGSPVAGHEDHGVGRARRVVLLREQAAERRRRAEHRQHAVGDVDGADLLGLRDPGDADGVAGPHRDVLKHAAVLAVGVVEKRRGAGVRQVQPRRGVIEHDQLVRLRIRQRLQQHAVDHAEDGGVGADADREGQHARRS